jgi:hypothetical protein
MDANDPCRAAYLPSSKSKMGIGANSAPTPLLVQTLDIGRALLRQPCRRSHTQSAAIASTSPDLGEPNLLCTWPDVDIKTWAVGD